MWLLDKGKNGPGIVVYLLMDLRRKNTMAHGLMMEAKADYTMSGIGKAAEFVVKQLKK
jgi:hypothetical protein